jgi:hypothetical protein
MFFYKRLLGDAIMTDEKGPLSDEPPDTSWIWIGGGLAAIFLVLGMFAIMWGGNAPVASTNTSPAPSTTGQRVQ